MQEVGAIIGLVSDRLQFGAQHLFALTQCRYAFAQLLKRQEPFLIGGKKPFEALADSCQFALQALFAMFRRIGGTRRGEASIEFLLD
jgi:hypothetical protein